MEKTLEEKQMEDLAKIKIAKAINQARIDFGINGINQDAFDDVKTAQSIIEGVREIRKAAKHEDVLEAIRLFGKGVIRFENQLSVVSTHNVVRSYEFYIREYLPKQNLVPKIIYHPPSHQLPSADEMLNRIARRELFEKYINDPVSMDGWYQKMFDQLQKIGLCRLTPEEQSKRYWDLARSILNPEEPHYPAELWVDRYKRGDMFKFKAVMMDGRFPQGEMFKNNAFHLYLVKRCKKDLITEALKIGKEKLIEIYELHNPK